ncbi:unnamed protein product, partial [Clonostachys rosea f. rosea IK726]
MPVRLFGIGKIPPMLCVSTELRRFLVPGHDQSLIEYAMDAGASIIVPQVDTVEQCKFFVSATKFGAKSNGTRSAPTFCLVPGISDG